MKLERYRIAVIGVLAAVVLPVVVGQEAATTAVPEKAAEAEPAEKTGEGTEVAAGREATAAPAVTVVSKEVQEQLQRMRAEKEAFVLQIEHAQARLDLAFLERKMEVAKMKMEAEELKVRNELAEERRKAEIADELAALRSENDKLTIEAAAAKAKSEALMYASKTAEIEMRSRISELSLAMEMIEKESDARNYTEEVPVYLKEPFENNRLTISDRRIELNGSISSKTADHVAERIDYFNNKDKELPIFIVIDNSPGGSVMSGYKILKAMHGSRAPVYVVVKQFAASMAACITTLADRSFAYPNAIILHHQLSGGLNGNLTQQREWVDAMEEWWRRLATPVAEKMGLTLDEFITKMYQNDSRGDWEEFADEAQKLKWVDHVIEEIRETSFIRNPDFRRTAPTAMATLGAEGAEGAGTGVAHGLPGYVGEDVDERGQPFYRLPRLSPPDLYWLYNPDGYYRLP